MTSLVLFRGPGRDEGAHLRKTSHFAIRSTSSTGNERRAPNVSLEGQTPLDVATETKPDIAELTNVRWTSDCAGLVQFPVAA